MPHSAKSCPGTCFFTCRLAVNVRSRDYLQRPPRSGEERLEKPTQKITASAAHGRQWWNCLGRVPSPQEHPPTGTFCRKCRSRSASGNIFWSVQGTAFL